MATTPAGLYYPSLSDPPNGPNQVQQLATSVDQKCSVGYWGETDGAAAVACGAANTKVALADSKVTFTLTEQRRVRIIVRCTATSTTSTNGTIAALASVVAGNAATRTGAIDAAGQPGIGRVVIAGSGGVVSAHHEHTFLLAAGTYSAFCSAYSLNATDITAANGYCAVYDLGSA